MKEVPDSYKQSSQRRLVKSWSMLADAVGGLPALQLNWENFENPGTIFSTSGATCLKCGSSNNVYAGVAVLEDPENIHDRIVTCEHFCKDCNHRIGWGFKVTRNDKNS